MDTFQPNNSNTTHTSNLSWRVNQYPEVSTDSICPLVQNLCNHTVPSTLTLTLTFEENGSIRGTTISKPCKFQLQLGFGTMMHRPWLGTSLFLFFSIFT